MIKPYRLLFTLLIWPAFLFSSGLQISKSARADYLGSEMPCQPHQRCPWLYLRAGLPVREDENLVQIIAVGDIQTGRQVQVSSKTFKLVTPWIQAADLALGNFEGVIAEAGMNAVALSTTKPGEPYRLVSPPGVERFIQQAGFDILGLANNHILDLGLPGMQNTIKRLNKADLQVFGVINSASAASNPLILDRKGLRIALIGYTLIRPPDMSVSDPIPALYDSLQKAVHQARQEADVVIVSIHWGLEYQLRPDLQQVRIAELLVESGADIILGHHPHVVQKTMILRSREGSISDRDHFVAYSLGNFIFDQYSGETQYGLAVRLFVDEHGLRAVQALPLRATARPRLLDADESAAILERIAPEPEKISFVCGDQDCQVTPGQATGQSGIFSNGQIDLTGDGAPERIELNNRKVSIFQDQALAWKSPEDWQILDLDIGDPNLDGRFELILSVRKPDESQILRSHPYIIGFRDGRYKLIWGGSALSYPISEVALGDVNGDQNQELIVLEELPGGEGSAVSIWRWHGWGFSLIWRSPSNTYRNLVLLEYTQNRGVDIQVEKAWGDLD